MICQNSHHQEQNSDETQFQHNSIPRQSIYSSFNPAHLRIRTTLKVLVKPTDDQFIHATRQVKTERAANIAPADRKHPEREKQAGRQGRHYVQINTTLWIRKPNLKFSSVRPSLPWFVKGMNGIIKRLSYADAVRLRFHFLSLALISFLSYRIIMCCWFRVGIGVS